MSWINSDDRYGPAAFASVAEAFGKFTDVDWIGRRPAIMAESGSPGQLVDGWFWRRMLWEKAGGLKAGMRLAGDFDLWTRFAEHSDFVMADAFFGTFRVRTGQLSSTIDRYHQEIDRGLTEDAIAVRQTMAKTFQEADTPDAVRAAGLECRIAGNRAFGGGWQITTRDDLGERDRLRAEHKVLRAERDSLAAERDGLRAERDGLRTERDGLRTERDSLTAERDGLLGSTSWRITAPIRAFGNLFR
jgi:hypothetical protein